MASQPSYRAPSAQQQQLFNVPPLSSIPSRRTMSSAYGHGMLFHNSEGYGLPFPTQNLEGSASNVSLFPSTQIGHHILSSPTPMSPTMTMPHQAIYGGLPGNPNDQLHLGKEPIDPARPSARAYDNQIEASRISASANGRTGVDTLMSAIQGRNSDMASTNPLRLSLNEDSFVSSHGRASAESKEIPSTFSSRARKKYPCHVSSCGKRFFQKTHLEIHMRAHTGYKPFVRQAKR